MIMNVIKHVGMSSIKNLHISYIDAEWHVQACTCMYGQEYCLVFVVLIAAGSFHSSRRGGSAREYICTCTTCVYMFTIIRLFLKSL